MKKVGVLVGCLWVVVVWRCLVLAGGEPCTGKGMVEASFHTPSFPDENIDSPALWVGPKGQCWLFATAKASHTVHLYDGMSGKLLRRVGGPGSKPGRFSRPNGIWPAGNLLCVVERDNHRVQLLKLPELHTIGFLGEDLLVKPYGIYALRLGPSFYRLYVTDNYTYGAHGTSPEKTGGRVKIFQFEIKETGIKEVPCVECPDSMSFGRHEGQGGLRAVDSICGDPLYNRLLVADEADDEHNIKVYDLLGNYTGNIIGEGLFSHDPEGIALYAEAEGTGFWICADQGQEENVFRVFDRRSLSYVGSFQAQATLNTDGVWLAAAEPPVFPSAMFYAVDDDKRVGAFPLKGILERFNKNLR
jgi:3-phytase